MIKKEIDEFNIKNLKERFAVQKIKNFIENDKNIFGKILVLYGLQRTGKTTMLEQVVKFYNNTKNVHFMKLQQKIFQLLVIMFVKYLFFRNIKKQETTICWFTIKLIINIGFLKSKILLIILKIKKII